MWLLDTDIASYIISGRSARAEQRLARCRSEEVAISAISLAELRYGLERRRNARLAAILDELIDSVQIEPFNREAAIEFSDIKFRLSQRGELIGHYDLQIAAQARATGRILVTHNAREFERVDGLDLDDWATDIP